MATTFIGKAVNASDPKMDHESVLAACTETFTFTGKATGVADPTIVGCLQRWLGIDAYEGYL